MLADPLETRAHSTFAANPFTRQLDLIALWVGVWVGLAPASLRAALRQHLSTQIQYAPDWQ